MRTMLRDTGTVFTRAMRNSLRNPAWLVISLMQPILYIVLFGPLLKPIANQLGGGNAYSIFVPGILVIIALLGAAFASVSYALALTLKSEDAFAPLLNAVVLPVLLLSGILLPMTLAPGWLQAISDVNPLKHVVEGVRSMFHGDYGTTTSWWALGLTLAMVVLGWWFGVRRFRRETG